jgi:hypothetical protein
MVTLAGGAAAVSFTGLALARRGRRHPASPRSVGGVRRRTRRRTRRRIRRRVYLNQRLYTLPYGCTVMRYRGSIQYYYCSGIWYRPAYQGETVIYIVEEIEPGAETNLEFEE